uniref:Uncharacterized protein n=1 Tax=Glossina palpalis gambiensis TaxID=67801 RepID=A0A1B0B1W1_9MUSC
MKFPACGYQDNCQSTQGNMDRRFVTYAKIDICSHDSQRLAPGRWLNYHVVEVYGQWILNKRVAAGIRDQVHLFSPFLYGKIAQASCSAARRGAAKCQGRNISQRKIENRELPKRGHSGEHQTLRGATKPDEVRPRRALRLAIVTATEGPRPAADQQGIYLRGLPPSELKSYIYDKTKPQPGARRQRRSTPGSAPMNPTTQQTTSSSSRPTLSL